MIPGSRRVIFRGPLFSLPDSNLLKSKERHFSERKVVAGEILDEVFMCTDGCLPLPLPSPPPQLVGGSVVKWKLCPLSWLSLARHATSDMLINWLSEEGR